MVRLTYILLAIALVFSIVLPGCTGDSEVEIREVVSQMVNAEEGGNITVKEEESVSLAGLQICIPPGALDSNQEIIIGEIAHRDLPLLPEEYMSLGYQFFLGPEGLSFHSPVTVYIPLPATTWQICKDIAAVEDFRLMKYEQPSGAWIDLPIRIDEMGVATAEVDDFCLFLPVMPPPELIDPIAFPNPSEEEPDNAASREQIEQQARDWLPPGAGEDYLQYWLDAEPVFIGDEDLTFADLISILLVTEAKWENVRDGHFYDAKKLIDIVLEDLPFESLKWGFKKAFGIKTVLGPAVTVGGWATEYAFELAYADTFDAQLIAYLSWRGWFWVREDRNWKYDAERGYDHATIIGGGLGPARYSGEPFQMIQTTGLPMRISMALFPHDTDWDKFFNDFGPSLYDFLHSVNDSDLEEERIRLRNWFAGTYEQPRMELFAPDTVTVGTEATLDAEITVGLTDEITFGEGETDKLAGRPVVWEWEQTAGPTVDFDKQSLRQTLLFTEPGEYVFSLHASDTLKTNDDWASIDITVVEQDPGKVYLTISSTAGGSVTTPEEGTHNYDAGTVVDLIAEVQETDYEPCYFVSWSGDVDTIADVNDPTTTITMNGDYSITANFGSDNIALGKPTAASSTRPGYPPENAVDGTAKGWGSGDYPPGWIEVDLQDTYSIGRIRLVVDQSPAGETVHQVLGKGPGTGGEFQVLHEFDGFTEAYQLLEYTPATPWEDIQVIRILTVTSPSWVGWHEIEVWEPWPAGDYYLAISSTDGGSVTSPSEGTHAYGAGTVVDLVAEVQETDYEPCYFVSWSGDVDTVADINDPTTTITINDNYTVTANFASDNVAFGKPTVASSTWSGYPPENAVDGLFAGWGSGDYAPGWIEVDLQGTYNIGRIGLVVGQEPDGETVHQVLGKGPGTGGEFQLLHEFQGFTTPGQVLEYVPATPWEGIQVIRVLTVSSPSWLWWREIEFWEP